MVKFDSKSGKLEFQHVAGREGLAPFVATDFVLDLEGLPENIRQLVIKVAKVSSCHASGQTISTKMAGEGSSGKTVETPLGTLERLLAPMRAKKERKLALESTPSVNPESQAVEQSGSASAD